jgi:hypothetical protein
MDIPIYHQPLHSLSTNVYYAVSRWSAQFLSVANTTLRRLLKRMGFSRKKGLWGRWNETNG